MNPVRLSYGRRGRRGCRRVEIASGWATTLRVDVGAGHGPPRGSAPTLGGRRRR
jgi:hypothetical protein